MLLPHGTIIALVDARNVALYRNSGDEAQPELTPVDTPRLDTHNHSGTSHHSSSGNHAAELVREDAHAIAMVEWLNTEAQGHRLAHLVVIAAPRTLGEMRKHYRKPLETALIGEVAKDLIGHKPPELLAALRAW